MHLLENDIINPNCFFIIFSVKVPLGKMKIRIIKSTEKSYMPFSIALRANSNVVGFAWETGRPTDVIVASIVAMRRILTILKSPTRTRLSRRTTFMLKGHV